MKQTWHYMLDDGERKRLELPYQVDPIVAALIAFGRERLTKFPRLNTRMKDKERYEGHVLNIRRNGPPKGEPRVFGIGFNERNDLIVTALKERRVLVYDIPEERRDGESA